MQGQKYKVWLVTSAFPSREDPISGIYIERQARALAQHVELTVFCFRLCGNGAVRNIPRHETCSYRLVEVSLPRTWGPAWSVGYLLGALRILLRTAREEGPPHLIHAHTLVLGGLVGCLLAKTKSLPAVLTEHAPTLPGLLNRAGIRAWLLRAALNSFQAVIFVSVPFARMFESHIKRTTPAFVIPNGVDIQLFRPGAPRRSNGPQLVSVGYLTPVKGHTYLLDAIAETAGELRARHAQVNFVGDGPEMSRLRRKVAVLDIQDLCHFTGAVTPNGVAETLGASDLLVLPSLRETFGLVLIEAMACGVPVLATACEGPSEIVTPEVGLLVRPGSAGALAEGLRTALATLDRFNPEEIRAEAVARYDLENVGRRVVEVYRQVIRGRPG